MKKQDNTLTLIIIAISAVFLFGGFGMMGFPFGTGVYGFSGMWIFGWLFMALIFTALVLFIVWIIKELQKK